MSESQNASLGDLYLSLEKIKNLTGLNMLREPAFKRDWEIVKQQGMHILDVQGFAELSGSHLGLTTERVLHNWRTFIDEGYNASMNIIQDLKIAPPDKVSFNFFTPKNPKLIAEMLLYTDGSSELEFNFVHLAEFFLNTQYANYEYLRHFGRYKFFTTLAHEHYHLRQFLKTPNTKESSLPYTKQKREYSARLYALAWLRKQSPENISEWKGLLLARLDVLKDLSKYSQVRHTVNRAFGIKDNKLRDIINGIRMITTNSV